MQLQKSEGTPKKMKTPKKANPSNNKQQTPKLAGAPGTPGSGKKNKKQKQQTPKPAIPIKPESAKKNKSPKNRKQTQSPAAKKQKTGLKESREIPQSIIQNSGFCNIRVNFPRWTDARESLTELLNKTDSDIFIETLFLQVKSKDYKKSVEEISDIKIGNSTLRTFASKFEDSLRKVLYVGQAEINADKIKKFFNASAVEKLINFKGKETSNYVLTFDDAKKALTAASKTFELEGKKYPLRPFMAKPEDSEKPQKKHEKATKRKLEEKEEEEEDDEDDEDEDMEDDDDDEEEEE